MHYEYRYRYYIQDHKDLSCRIYAIRPDIETINVLELYPDRQYQKFIQYKSKYMDQHYTKAFMNLRELQHYLEYTFRRPDLQMLISVPKYCAVQRYNDDGYLIRWEVYQDGDRDYPMDYVYQTLLYDDLPRKGSICEDMDNLLMESMNIPKTEHVIYKFFDNLEDVRQYVLDDLDELD